MAVLLLFGSAAKYHPRFGSSVLKRGLAAVRGNLLNSMATSDLSVPSTLVLMDYPFMDSLVAGTSIVHCEDDL